MTSWPESVQVAEGWTCAPEGGEPVAMTVPGTAASAWRAAGLRWEDEDFDERAWVFRAPLRAATASAEGERLVLCLDGVATLGSVVLDGAEIGRFGSMWRAERIDVTALLSDGAEHVLELRCEALGPLVRAPRKPRARWRAASAANGLRWYRTTLLGRAPGFAPHPAAVGPWRAVRLERSGPGPAIERVALRPRIEGADGVLEVRIDLRKPIRATSLPPAGTDVAQVGGADRLAASATLVVRGHGAEARAPLAETRSGTLTATVLVASVVPWWPCTHGEPALYDVVLADGDGETPLGRTGFRTLRSPGDLEADGLALHVNDVPVFARGAVWTPPDPVSLAAPPADVRTQLEAMAAAGMNLVRFAGTTVYADDATLDLCDELGLLVWHDAMLANLDYPLADEGFRAEMEAELGDLAQRLAGRPCAAVLCGGSEVAQQVAMLGLDPAELLRDGVGETLLPAAARAARADAIVVPDAPWGGARPFVSDRGVANWFGVGGYRLGLDATRRAGVRFASECLAFANVPDGVTDRATGVVRDAGSEWDFADVRDHYLQLLHGLDPQALARDDLATYLERSALVSGEVMAEVLGEWRRAGSPCGGAVLLWLRDLVPGSGWGVLDHTGAPKAAWHHLRRALAPVAVWSTDEATNGLAVHVANDTATALDATLTLGLVRGGERGEQAEPHPVTLAPRSGQTVDAEACFGRFLDLTYAYRFGPSQHEAVVAELHDRDGILLSRHTRFVTPPPTTRESAADLGLEATLDGTTLHLTTRRLVYGLRIHADGATPSDDAFTLPPGAERTVTNRPGRFVTPVILTAANLDGRVVCAEAALGDL